MSYTSADQEWSQQQNCINWTNTSLDPYCCLCWLKDNFNNGLPVLCKWDHYNYAFSPRTHSKDYKKRLDSEKQKTNLQQFASLKLNTTELPAACLCCPTIIQPYRKKPTVLKQLLVRALGSKNVACEPAIGGWKSMGVDQNWRCGWNKRQGTWVAYLQIALSLLSHQCACKEDCVLHSFHISQGWTSPFWGQNTNIFQFTEDFVNSYRHKKLSG